MQQRKRILVVGGSGFIGKHIVSFASELGWDVTNISLRPTDLIKSSGVRDITVDISDSIAVKNELSGLRFEYVVNCGGYIDHTLYFSSGRSVIETHFIGVMNLVDILDKEVLESFINIGSSDEYGNIAAPQSEAQRESPISPYSLSKVAATHFLQMLFRTENFPATTLRLYLTYGPGQDAKRFLPQIISGCLEGKKFSTSKGEQLRDFCFIQDTVEAIFIALTKAEAKGEIINIASGQAITIKKMIETIKGLIGKGEPQYGEIEYRPGENMSLYANIMKAEELLNWKPKINLEEGLRSTIDWVERGYE
jgi:UDP-glucose 4-epimerase